MVPVSRKVVTVPFNVRSTLSMRKIMDRYAKAKAMDVNALRFTFDGQRFSADTSPEQLASAAGLQARGSAAGGPALPCPPPLPEPRPKVPRSRLHARLHANAMQTPCKRPREI